MNQRLKWFLHNFGFALMIFGAYKSTFGFLQLFIFGWCLWEFWKVYQWANPENIHIMATYDLPKPNWVDGLMDFSIIGLMVYCDIRLVPIYAATMALSYWVMQESRKRRAIYLEDERQIKEADAKVE
jgi:hypothetical protein